MKTKHNLVKLLQEKQEYGTTGYVNFPTISNSELADYLMLNDVTIVQRGNWIRENDGTYSCSVCGHDEVYTYDGTRVLGVACPFCGSIMSIEEQ